MTEPTLQLEVLTPDKKVVNTTAEAMRVLLPDGWWGILPGHAAMMAHIKSGMIYYQKDGTIRYIAIYQAASRSNKGPRTHPCPNLTAAAEEGEDMEAVQLALSQQATKLAALAREADLEFNQIKFSLEKSLQGANITDGR